MSTPASLDRGWVIPESTLFDTLTLGLGLLTDTVEAGTIDSYVRRIFHNVDTAKRAQIVKFFAETEVSIKQNFPQDAKAFPGYVILLTADEQAQFVGDQGGSAEYVGDTESPLFKSETNAEQWTTTLGVGCLSEHPEETIWLYQLAKWTLSAQRRLLAQQFGLMQRLSGRDLGFEKIYMPRFVYRRDLYWNVGYLQWDAEVRNPVEIDDVDGSPKGVSESLAALQSSGLDLEKLSNL